jgi:hypothetical protein
MTHGGFSEYSWSAHGVFIESRNALVFSVVCMTFKANRRDFAAFLLVFSVIVQRFYPELCGLATPFLLAVASCGLVAFVVEGC